MSENLFRLSKEAVVAWDKMPEPDRTEGPIFMEAWYELAKSMARLALALLHERQKEE